MSVINQSYLETCNYVEIFYVPKQNDIISTSTGLTKEIFNNIMSKMINEKYKYFQKDLKQYVIGTLFYENDNNEDLKVIKKECKEITHTNSFMTVYFDRCKMTMLNLPSTNLVHDCTYIRRLTFRINNRVYLNFECKKKTNTDTTYYTIYMNYNHDTGVDVNASCNTIQEILDKLI